MKRWAIFLTFIFALLAHSCSKERSTGPSADRFKGNLRVFVVDSFHLNDSTVSLGGPVNYSISHESGYFNDGTIEIDSTSTLGMSYELDLDSIPAGNYSATFVVSRPLVILDRKDDTGRARFTDIKTIAVPRDSTVALAPVEIWAYRANRLVIYFEPNIAFPQADSILRASGVTIIGRTRSVFNDAPLYRVSTEGVGTEVELKPNLEELPGVQAAYFDIFGHSYF